MRKGNKSRRRPQIPRWLRRGAHGPGCRSPRCCCCWQRAVWTTHTRGGAGRAPAHTCGASSWAAARTTCCCWALSCGTRTAQPSGKPLKWCWIRTLVPCCPLTMIFLSTSPGTPFPETSPCSGKIISSLLLTTQRTPVALCL